MKEKELLEHAKCDICKLPVGNSGLPLFWTVYIQRHGILMDAVRRQDGLAAMLGGNGALARVMGTDEEMTQLVDEIKLTVCEKCAIEWEVNIAELLLSD